MLKPPPVPELLSILESGAGKFNVFGVTGVSCALGSSGFSIKGKAGSNKDVLANCCCMLARTTCADKNGFTSPIFAAFSANACCISADIFIGLKILLFIAPTSTPESLSVAELNPDCVIPKVLAAS